MDPNNSDSSTNQLQQDAAQADASQQASTQPPADQGQQEEIPAPVVDEQNTDQPQPVDQGQQQNQPPASAAPQGANYIDDVGGSVVDLLDDIDESEELVEIVAKEMKLDAQEVRRILDGLLNKIDQSQITIEELALIMAAPVVDEVEDQQQ